MEFGISTYSFRDQELTPHLLDRLRLAGFRQLELYANRPHLDYHDRAVRRSIAGFFETHALPPPSLHLPYFEQVGPKSNRPISPLATGRLQRREAIDEVKRALELTDRMMIAHVVVHLGIAGERFNPIHFDHAYSLIHAISSFAGVDILIENIPNEISSLDRIREFLDTARVPDIGICYDSGHGRLDGSAPELERVGAIHLNDNNGQEDSHLWPFDGAGRWAALVERLVDADYNGPLIFEVAGDEFDRGHEAGRRLASLADEARASLEEFGKKYSIGGSEEP